MQKRVRSALWCPLFAVAALSAGAAITPLKPSLPGVAGRLLDSPDGKTVRILDAKGTPIVSMGAIQLWCRGPIHVRPAKAQETAPGVWKIDYEFVHKNPYRRPVVTTTVTAKGGPVIEIVNSFNDPADGGKGTLETASGFLFLPATNVTLCTERQFVKTGAWRRDTVKGGVPFEIRGDKLKYYDTPDGRAYMWFYDPTWLYAHGNTEGRHRLTYDTTVAGAQTNHTARILFFVPQAEGGKAFAEAAANGSPVSVSFAAANAFHAFDSSRETPACTVALANTGTATRRGELQIDVYDWDGRQIDKFREKSALGAFERRTYACTFPKEADEMWFLEARFVMDEPFPDPLWRPRKLKKGEKPPAEEEKQPILNEVFARTQIAAMSPYAFRHLDTSMMGLSAVFFSVPGQDAALSFAKTLGARWQRFGGSKDDIGDNRVIGPRYQMRTIYSQGPNGRLTNQADRVDYVVKQLRRALERQCPYFEFGNEINFGNNTEQEVKYYQPWCEAMREALKQVPCKGKMRITTFGYAGSDSANLGLLYKKGLMDVFDDVSLHPGRLNQTPDNPGPAWAWNYLAAIHDTKDCIRTNGGKQGLIMTEVYARTPPNRGDSDSMRMAGENVFLSCVLAKAEGVSVLLWYQMHDGVHCDIGGADPKDTEHHYGIVMRDGVVKPSALAFRMAARVLDGATFVKTVNRTGTHLNAYCFTSPEEGPVAVLWDRTDGCIAYPDMSHGHMDPWIRHWKTRTEYEFACSKPSVTVFDCIGRRTVVKAVDGKVRIPLDGAAVAVYGLDL